MVWIHFSRHIYNLVVTNCVSLTSKIFLGFFWKFPFKWPSHPINGTSWQMSSMCQEKIYLNTILIYLLCRNLEILFIKIVNMFTSSLEEWWGTEAGEIREKPKLGFTPTASENAKTPSCFHAGLSRGNLYSPGAKSKKQSEGQTPVCQSWSWPAVTGQWIHVLELGTGNNGSEGKLLAAVPWILTWH